MFQKAGLFQPFPYAHPKPLLNAVLTLLITLLALFGGDTHAEMPVSEDRITGTSYGNSPELAKQMALSQVVYKINRRITFNRCQNDFVESSTIDCSSLSYHFDFPLKGVRYQDLESEPGQFAQQATLSRDSVEAHYASKLPLLRERINKGLSDKNPSPESLQDLWQARDAFIAYFELLTLFGIDADRPLSKEQLQAIQQLEAAAATTIEDLDQLSDPIVRLGKVQNAYIHAPSPEGSVEMTPFSELVRRTLSQQFSKRFPEADIKLRGQATRGLVRYQPCHDPVRNLEKNCPSAGSITPTSGSQGDEALLLGNYRQGEDSVLLRYRLLDINSGQARTALIRIPKNLIEGIRTTPIDPAFDQELHKNILGDDEFHVRLSSSRGDRNILIYEKENITLKWRASQAAYFYIVGHVVHRDQQYSYLVELDPANGTFVGRIGPEQANRWVEIGEFTVYPPLGVEHIQLVAANYDLKNRLPPTRWDESLGYHVIQGSENDAMAGLEKVRGLQRVCSSASTRGLQRVCSSQTKIETTTTQTDRRVYEHESVLSYTSLPRTSADDD